MNYLYIVLAICIAFYAGVTYADEPTYVDGVSSIIIIIVLYVIEKVG